MRGGLLPVVVVRLHDAAEVGRSSYRPVEPRRKKPVQGGTRAAQALSWYERRGLPLWPASDLGIR